MEPVDTSSTASAAWYPLHHHGQQTQYPHREQEKTPKTLHTMRSFLFWLGLLLSQQRERTATHPGGNDPTRWRRQAATCGPSWRVIAMQRASCWRDTTPAEGKSGVSFSSPGEGSLTLSPLKPSICAEGSVVPLQNVGKEQCVPKPGSARRGCIRSPGVCESEAGGTKHHKEAHGTSLAVLQKGRDLVSSSFKCEKNRGVSFMNQQTSFKWRHSRPTLFSCACAGTCAMRSATVIWKKMWQERGLLRRSHDDLRWVPAVRTRTGKSGADRI